MTNNLLFKKLFYRSLHRGCKETDIIFGKFAQSNLHLLSKKELIEYEKLLNVDDAVFCDWILYKKPIPNEYNTPILKKIKAFSEICN